MTLTIVSEFYRGARVIASRDGSNLLSAVGELTMRNTRRYGGYIVHFAMVLIFIGIAGVPFNQDIQKEMNVRAELTIGPYTILCQNFDQPSTTITNPSAPLLKFSATASPGNDALPGAPPVPREPSY